MDCLKRGTYGIIALLPSLVKGALLISIMRAMRERGLNLHSSIRRVRIGTRATRRTSRSRDGWSTCQRWRPKIASRP